MRDKCYLVRSGQTEWASLSGYDFVDLDFGISLQTLGLVRGSDTLFPSNLRPDILGASISRSVVVLLLVSFKQHAGTRYRGLLWKDLWAPSEKCLRYFYHNENTSLASTCWHRTIYCVSFWDWLQSVRLYLFHCAIYQMPLHALIDIHENSTKVHDTQHQEGKSCGCWLCTFSTFAWGSVAALVVHITGGMVHVALLAFIKLCDSVVTTGSHYLPVKPVVPTFQLSRFTAAGQIVIGTLPYLTARYQSRDDPATVDYLAL